MSFSSFDISASGLHAQRLRMDTISSNIANVNTTRDENGNVNPYIKKNVVFKAVYDKATSGPDFPFGGVHPEYNKETESMCLKGRISFDSRNVSNGVEVQQIEEDKEPYKMIYDPSHPDADEEGYVKMPNINAVTEMVNLMVASRAYEANVTAAEAAKSMIRSALQI